jgi:hypothetical protein
MIWQIDTSKVPDKDIAFLAEVMSISYKNNCTIDETIEEMKDVLRKK